MDDDDYTSQQIEDNQFLNKLDIERSYVGSKPDVEHHRIPINTALNRLKAIQELQWWREGDRDPRIDMELETKEEKEEHDRDN